MLVHQQNRDGLFYKNHLLASGEEINQTLESCILWLGRFVELVGEEYQCEILVCQTSQPMELQQITCEFSQKKLTLSWSLKENKSKKIVTQWTRF